MDSKTTQGTSRASMIILTRWSSGGTATTPRPVGGVETLSTVAQPSSQMSPSGAAAPTQPLLTWTEAQHY